MTTFDDDNASFDDANPPEESNNRTFLLIAGVLGGLVFLGLLCIAGYFIYSSLSTNANVGTSQAQSTQQQVTIQAGLTQRSLLQAQTQTAAVTNTVPPSETPVIAQASPTASPTSNPATVTIAAAFTRIANTTQTLVVIPTSTRLPNTGIAEDLGGIGLAGLMLITVMLVGVIFLVRRLRTSPGR